MTFRDLAGRTQLYVAAWIAAALTAVAISAAVQQIGMGDGTALLVLTACAVGYDELSRRVEAARRGLATTAHGTHVSMRSAWAVLGLVELPISLFAVFVAALYLHAGVTTARAGVTVPIHRHLFNASTMVGSAAAAALVLHSLAGGLADSWAVDDLSPAHSTAVLAAAVLTYFAVNSAGLAGVFAVTRGRPRRNDLGDLAGNLLELGTLALGALCALVGSNWTVVFAAPLLFLLQRSALVDDLVTAARSDPKTDLLNAAAWHATADALLTRLRSDGGTASLLLVDVDHFKAVNDTYGHLAGDQILAAVADTLTQTLRAHDLIGRFGGEEFVALLPDLNTTDALAAAERVRVAIEQRAHQLTGAGDHGETVQLTVTASIGVAATNDHHTTLHELLADADTAMYRAKNHGRNQVATARAPDDGVTA